MNFQPNIPKTPKPVLRPVAQPPVRFGAAPGGITGGVDAVFRRLTEDRTMQMLAEDLIGFGVMRTGVDLWRGKAYGNDQVNWPAGFERLGRETASIFTDNVLAGLVAAGMGKVIFDRMGKHKAAGFNNQFVDYPTVEAFQDAVKPLKSTQTVKEAEAAFLNRLSQYYFASGTQASPELQEKGKNLLTSVWENARQKPTEKFQLPKAKFNALLKANPLNTKDKGNGFSFVQDITKDGKVTKSFNLQALLEDVHGFSQHMGKVTANAPAGKSWQALANESIARTLKAKAVTIPVGLGMATAATFAVPFAISAASRKFLGIDYYPGEIGLRKEDKGDKKGTSQSQAGKPPTPQKSFWQRHAPYLTESYNKGNYWPIFWTLAPLPLAAGLLNTTRLGKLGLPVFVKSAKEWKQLFDYKKGAPWTAQQQMSSLFAVLITSRLLNSRSDNEFNERVLDSFVGWGAWIMGTPLLNKMAANFSDKAFKTRLMKADGTLRNRAEIDALKEIEDVAPRVFDKTLNSHIWMNAGTTLLTMGILGLLIPWAGVKMTQNNENRKQQLREAQAPPMPSAQPAAMTAPAKPWGVSAQPSPFGNSPAQSAMGSGFTAQRSAWQFPSVATNQV